MRAIIVSIVVADAADVEHLMDGLTSLLDSNDVELVYAVDDEETFTPETLGRLEADFEATFQED